jgi:HEAT repeat protein
MVALDKEKLISDINQLGYNIKSIDDLKKIDTNNKDVIPILLEHLCRINDEQDKEFLVRCLGVKGFNEVTEILLKEFKNSSNISYKWAIGNSLSLIADKNSFADLIQIVQESEHGIARQTIVDTLGKLKNKQAIPVLINLLKDDDVQGHAVIALSKFKDPSSIPYIEPLVSHKVTWIRNAAKKAINKLENTGAH